MSVHHIARRRRRSRYQSPDGQYQAMMNCLLSRPLVLIGLMGTGKSTVGRALATRLGVAYWDNDRALDEATGMSAAQVVEREGMKALHGREMALLRDVVAAAEPRVISAAAAVIEEGGAAVALEPARVVWLRAAVPTIVARLHATPGPRPFLGGDLLQTVSDMSRVRAPLYAGVADQIVDVEGRSVEEIADEIARAVPGSCSPVPLPGR